jgi:serine/threonine protein kinase
VCGMPLILGNDRYVPIEALGQGGFGYTFLAWDLKFPYPNGTYATRVIKQFRSDQLGLPGQIESALRSFKQEVQILSTLKHPQIPLVYEPFQVQTTANTYAYFVQEHVPGKDLQVGLRARKATDQSWTEAEIRDLLTQLLEILNYIHTRFAAPIVHRDIKPSNIIQGEDGRFHLVDFGSVKQVVATIESGLSQPETQCVVSEGYSPPEQYHGQVDCSSDLYALGKTCISLLTGSQAPQRDWQKGRSVSPKLVRVLQRMTQSDPQERYRSASAVLHQLQGTKNQKRWYHVPPWLMLGGAAALSIALFSHGYAVVTHPSKPPIPVRDYQNKLPNISSVTDVPSGEFKYGGSTTWLELYSRLNPIIKQTFPQLVFTWQAPPKNTWVHSEAGIDMLIQGQLDFALSSKGIPDKQKQKAQVANVKLKEIPIAISSTAIIVNPNLTVDAITGPELDLIKQGKIKNWNELRGPNRTITIYQTDQFYLEGADFVKVMNATEAHQRIAKDIGGITISPAQIAVSQCQIKALSLGSDLDHLVHPYQQKTISISDCLAGRKNKINLQVIEDVSYLLRRELSIIIIEDGGRKQWIGETYAYILRTSEAQNQIRVAGYVPIDRPIK